MKPSRNFAMRLRAMEPTRTGFGRGTPCLVIGLGTIPLGIDPTLEVAEGDWPNVMDEAEGDASLSEKVSMLAQGITQPA